MDIRLNFINASNDANNSSIVIFQKNVAAGAEEAPVAWKVIQQCGAGKNHPFLFSTDLSLSAADNHGNYSPALPAEQGRGFAVHPSGSGRRLAADGAAPDPSQFHVLNGLSGPIDARMSSATDGRSRSAAPSPRSRARSSRSNPRSGSARYRRWSKANR